MTRVDVGHFAADSERSGKKDKMRNTSEILEEIIKFTPDNGNWLHLDALLAELWQLPASTEWVAPLLAVFERFPDEDGAGVMWGIIHGVESIDGYEPILEASARARPTWLKSVMLKRIKNAEDEAPATPRTLRRWRAEREGECSVTE